MGSRGGLAARGFSVRAGSGGRLGIPVGVRPCRSLTRRGVSVVVGSGRGLRLGVSVQGWIALCRCGGTRGDVVGVVVGALRSAVPLVLAAARGHLPGVVQTPTVLGAGAASPSRHRPVVPTYM